MALRLRFFPEVEPSSIAQVSIDLRLGHRFVRLRRPPPAYISAIHVDSAEPGSHASAREQLYGSSPDDRFQSQAEPIPRRR